VTGIVKSKVLLAFRRYDESEAITITQCILLVLGLALLIAVSVSGTTFLGIAVILLFAVKVTMVNSLTAKITVKKLGLP
jgi:hypothetical protein